MRPLAYDLDHNPIRDDDYDARERIWADPRRIVGKDVINDRWLISTVFLSIDHSFAWAHPDDWETTPPLLYETMVFDQEEDCWHDHWMDRYATREEALEGHAKIVGMVRELESVGGSQPPYGD